MIEIKLLNQISDSRLDGFLKILYLVKNGQSLLLNWERVEQITPAGYAVLACLNDSIIENNVLVKNIKIKKTIKENMVVNNLLNNSKYKFLPAPNINNFNSKYIMLKGNPSSIDITFMDDFYYKFTPSLPDELFFSFKLIMNELMQNSISHSGSERYYMYAGLWKNEVHLGVLDMGVSIPARLEQKYMCNNDLDYLDLAFVEGISTRRLRPGGLGLSHTIDTLKNNKGKLTILSRKAQIKKYFATRKTSRSILNYPLNGTWCFARFNMEGVTYENND